MRTKAVTLAINRGSMSELIENGRTGILVEDFEEGYYRINECFQMDREYIASRAKLLFNYRAMTRGYILAYEKVLNREIDKDFEPILAEPNLINDLA